MGVKEHKCHAAVKHVNVCVLTISNTRTKATDESGKLIRSMVTSAGHKVVYYNVIKDNFELVQSELKRALALPARDVIITNGGTGLSTSDITIDAVTQFISKSIDGFGDLFRYLSYVAIGSASMLSRACAGVIRHHEHQQPVIIFCLPGSPHAVKLALEKLILPELGHLVWEINR
jgi:molybdenum cofactor biosynthesis protein B